MENTELHFLGRRVTGEDLTLIQEIVASCGSLSRMELARTVCELLRWRRRSASLKARECREFLEKLDTRGLLVLPDKRAGRPVGSRTEVPQTEHGNPGAVVVGTAHDVGRLELELVQTDEIVARVTAPPIGSNWVGPAAWDGWIAAAMAKRWRPRRCWFILWRMTPPNS